MGREKRGNQSVKVRMKMEEIQFPPFNDILVLAANCSQGRIGMSKAIELLVPGVFKMHVPEGVDHVEAVYINKKILGKLDIEEVLSLLSKHVFPYMSEGEIVKVDFEVLFGYIEAEPDSE